MSEREALLTHRILDDQLRMKRGHFTRANMVAPVDPRRGDLLLLACCFTTGMLDCGVFNNYGVFVGMQTGNTIILCLSTARLPASEPYAYATTLVSILSFTIGAFVTARISNSFGALRRCVLALNFLVQTLCIVIAGLVITLKLIPTDDRDVTPSILDDPRIIGGIPALAFQSGATIATSRLLGYGNEIPVNVLTSTYAALATDKRLFAWDNPPRNRRVGAAVCIVSGALIAAWIQKKGPGLLLVIWICVAVKACLVVGVLLGFEGSGREAWSHAT